MRFLAIKLILCLAFISSNSFANSYMEEVCRKYEGADLLYTSDDIRLVAIGEQSEYDEYRMTRNREGFKSFDYKIVEEKKHIASDRFWIKTLAQVVFKETEERLLVIENNPKLNLADELGILEVSIFFLNDLKDKVELGLDYIKKAEFSNESEMTKELALEYATALANRQNAQINFKLSEIFKKLNSAIKRCP